MATGKHCQDRRIPTRHWCVNFAGVVRPPVQVLCETVETTKILNSLVASQALRT